MLQVVLAEQRVDHSLGLSFSDVRLLIVVNHVYAHGCPVQPWLVFMSAQRIDLSWAAQFVHSYGCLFNVHVLILQVELRRGEYGFNEIEQDEDEPLWRKYLENFKDPLIGLLLASAFVRCLPIREASFLFRARVPRR